MSGIPNFRTTKIGDLITKLTPEAEEVKRRYKSRPTVVPLPPVQSSEEVDRRARESLLTSGIHQPDDVTLFAEYKLQRGQYTGRSFKWVLENDPGYGFYLWREHLKGPSPAKTKVEADRVTGNIAAMVTYMSMFEECRKTHGFMLQAITAEAKAKETGDAGYNVLGFGKYCSMRYKEITSSQDREHQKYCRWITGKKNVMPGSSMFRFQQYLQQLKPTPSSDTKPADQARTTPQIPTAPDPATTTEPCMPTTSSAPCQPISSIPSPSTSTAATFQPATTAAPGLPTTKVVQPTPRPTIPAPPQSTMHAPRTSTNPDPTVTPGTTAEGTSWLRFVSPAQEKWMKGELKTLGLLPGTVEYLQPSRWRGQPLWRTPPPGELQLRSANQLPVPDPFWLHPMFVWCPEVTCQQLLGTAHLPCITPSCTGRAEKKGVGKPRVVVGTGGGNSGLPNTGQYYIVASTLYCRKCRCSPFASDQPSYLKMLPQSLQNLFPAVITYRKAVCKSLVDQMRRSGRSPSDMAKEIRELLQLRYERSHGQYLLMLTDVRNQARSHTNLDEACGLDPTLPSGPFGDYDAPHGYRGVTISEQFLAGVLITEYQDQKPYLYGMLKGVFGKYWRADHTRTLANKVELLSGVMWSFCTFNEFWEVVSWVMVDSDSELALKPYYCGLAKRYEQAGVEKAAIRWIDKWCCVSPPYKSAAATQGQDREILPPSSGPNSAGVEVLVDRSAVNRRSSCRQHFNKDIVELLDSFHCIRRFAKACTSAAHPAYPRFMSLLSSAFFVVDSQDLENLRRARSVIGAKGEPVKKEIRRHCRTVIPGPQELEKRVKAVIESFEEVADANNVPLFGNSMADEWKLQRTHIRHGCLSDPIIHSVEGDVTEEAGGILYRLVEYVHLGGVKSPDTRLPVWQPLRGTSQLEGFHPHQARWVTGTRVSPALFQAQAFLGLGRWNWSRAVEHRKLKLPAFDPKLTSHLNHVYNEEYGVPKYPDFSCSNIETGELFGIEYTEEVAASPELPEQQHIQAIQADEGDEWLFMGDLDAQQHVEQMIKSKSTIPKSTKGTRTPGIDAAPLTAPDLSTPASGTATSSAATSSAATSSAATSSAAAKPTPSDQAPSTSSTKHHPSIKQTQKMQKNMMSGTVTYWHYDRWTPSMKTVLNNLLAKYTGKDRMEKVISEYRRLVYAATGDEANQLRMTNKHFIQLYERKLNRSLEGQAAVNFSEEQTLAVERLTTDLASTTDVPTRLVSHFDSQPTHDVEQVPPPKGPLKRTRGHEASDLSSDSEPEVVPPPSAEESTDSFQKMAKLLESFMSQKKKKKTKKMKKAAAKNKDSVPAPVPVPRHRMCTYCGLPKSKNVTAGNLHYTYVKKGEQAFFYCPKKYSDMYGTPVAKTFAEFRDSEHWAPAVQEILQDTQQKAQRKAEAERKRAEMGWKKPGGSRK